LVGFGGGFGGGFGDSGSLWGLLSDNCQSWIWGEIRRTRPIGLSAEHVSRSVKEVAINCGWIDEARAGRIFNFK
jgi:hypothetical protein